MLPYSISRPLLFKPSSKLQHIPAHKYMSLLEQVLVYCTMINIVNINARKKHRFNKVNEITLLGVSLTACQTAHDDVRRHSGMAVQMGIPVHPL